MEGDVVPETDHKVTKPLNPWLANQIRDALNARDVDTVFMLLGDYLEYHRLRVPASRLADYRARGLLEEGEGGKAA